MLLGRTYQKYFQTRRPQFIDRIREIRSFLGSNYISRMINLINYT